MIKCLLLSIYAWPNRKSASSKHTLSGPQKTDSGLLNALSALQLIGSCFNFVICLLFIDDFTHFFGNFKQVHWTELIL